MPTVEWNLHQWDKQHNWEKAGAEWSTAWGNDDMQWYGSILPRLHLYLPAKRVLEIAPGYGRWTRFLANYCEHLNAVDLSPNCIDYCKEHFPSEERISFVVNDGRTLPMINDKSIDLVFSFDSLVHVEIDIIESYLKELSRVLSDEGIAFIHHSNLAEYSKYFRVIKKIKALLNDNNDIKNHSISTNNPIEKDLKVDDPVKSSTVRFLEKVRRLLLIDSDHSRALSVSASKVSELALESGLRCISQEKINWGSRRMIDCISVLTPINSKWPSHPILNNTNFMLEAKMNKHIADSYTRP